MTHSQYLIRSLPESLSNWYLQNHRPLPWRSTRDPYRIWLSEIMLQQTTVPAVLPFYEKFLRAFPNVQALAKSPLERVLELWSGLGYYSRARNLHKAAQKFAAEGFPSDFLGLMNAPGLGPYTARAVAAFAFNQKVGVLDGNVIRLLSRHFAIRTKWWTTKGRNELQTLADRMVENADPFVLNQALIELGATICSPQTPSCLLCPWQKTCIARQKGLIEKLPMRKQKKVSEPWIYEVSMHQKRAKWALVKNSQAPFLKGQWIFPGEIKRGNKKPKSFHVRHSITHHDIFITVKKTKKLQKQEILWSSSEDIKKVNPSSLLTKILQVVSSAAVAASIISCAHAKSQPVPASPPPVVVAAAADVLDIKGKVLTKVGSNESPVWAPDGRGFLFVSSHREKHFQRQIYEFSLEDLSEHRLVFNDANALDPMFLPSGKEFRFLSNTDRVKELPKLIYKSDAEDRDFEEFVYSMNGVEMKKLGVSKRKPNTQIEILAGKKKYRVFVEDEDHLFIAGEHSNKEKLEILFAGRSVRNLTPGLDGKTKSFYFSAISNVTQKRQIFGYSMEDKQISIIYSSTSADLSEPAVSPSGETMLYVATLASVSQIVMDQLEPLNKTNQ